MRHSARQRSSARRRPSSSLRVRSGIQTAASRHWQFASAFPSPRLDQPRGHLDWRLRKTEHAPGCFEVLALDPRSGQEVGHVYYELHGRDVLITLLHVNARYRRSDCLLALLAHPRAYITQGYRLRAWGLEPGSRLARLYARYRAADEARRREARRPLWRRLLALVGF